MAFTISTQFGDEVRREHNLRIPEYVLSEDHIDPDGIHEIWIDEPHKEAYARLFGLSIGAYNEKQTRSDRMISDYYERIKADKKKAPVYEVIVQVGGRDNMPDTDTSYQIYREFVDGWSERNPNFEIIGAYYHADEEGAPHVHVDFIPVAHGYSKGPSTQTSFKRALKEQGISIGDKTLAPIKFYNKENQVLEEICRGHDLEIIHPKAEKVKHLWTKLYKLQQEVARTNAALETSRNELDDALTKFNEIQAARDSIEEQRDAMRREVEALEKQHEALTREIEASEEQRIALQEEVLKASGLRAKFERLRKHCSRYTLPDGKSVLEKFDESEVLMASGKEHIEHVVDSTGVPSL